MMKTLTLLMLFTFCLQAQFSVLNNDTASVANTDTLTGRWIVLNNIQNIEGQASLFVVGDTLSGNVSKRLIVQMQTRGGRSATVNNMIASQWQVLDSVSAAYLGQNIGAAGGTILSGYWIDIADKATAWNKSHAIRFRFFFKSGVGTHNTRLYALMEIR